MSKVSQLKQSAIAAVEELYSACQTDVGKLESEVESLEQKIEDLQGHVSAPRWGSCRRGCPESYLDDAGFCSPACAVGSPRGKFATVATVQR